jgi:hypothetical protein
MATLVGIFTYNRFDIHPIIIGSCWDYSLLQYNKNIGGLLYFPEPYILSYRDRQKLLAIVRRGVSKHSE